MIRIRDFYRLGIMVVLLLSVSGPIHAQEAEDPQERIFTPYRKEPTHYDHLTPYYRNFDTLDIRKELDSIRSKETWDHRDTIRIVCNLIKTRKWKEARRILNRTKRPLLLEGDEIQLVALAYQQQNKWDQAREMVGLADFEADHDKVVHYWSKMLSFRSMLADDKSWGKDRSVFEFDTSQVLTKKQIRAMRDSVLREVRAMDEVLHWQIQVIPSSDAVISKMAMEIGAILERFSSYTEAWIMYKLAKQYDKYDMGISKELKRVNHEMAERRYRIPSFRQYFPKIEPGRFQYSFLKEKMLQKDSTDTVNEDLPILQEGEEDPIPWLDTHLAVAVGCLLAILLVVLLLRTRRR